MGANATDTNKRLLVPRVLSERRSTLSPYDMEECLTKKTFHFSCSNLYMVAENQHLVLAALIVTKPFMECLERITHKRWKNNLWERENPRARLRIWKALINSHMLTRNWDGATLKCFNTPNSNLVKRRQTLRVVNINRICTWSGLVMSTNCTHSIPSLTPQP